MLLQIPGNDNLSESWVGSEENASYLSHIPLANLLIKKHGTQWWKNHPTTWDYRYAQIGICYQLSHVPAKELGLRTIAFFLECSPVSLLNDPEISSLFSN